MAHDLIWAGGLCAGCDICAQGPVVLMALASCTTGEGSAATVQQEEAKPWEDDGTLPTDAGGMMPFYFTDAHEEPNNPGTLHLFGKVHGW